MWNSDGQLKYRTKVCKKKKFAKISLQKKKIEPAHVRRYYKTHLNTGPVLQVKVPNNIGKKRFISSLLIQLLIQF